MGEVGSEGGWCCTKRTQVAPTARVQCGGAQDGVRPLATWRADATNASYLAADSAG